jgi:hypothetical protein
MRYYAATNLYLGVIPLVAAAGTVDVAPTRLLQLQHSVAAALLLQQGSNPCVAKLHHASTIFAIWHHCYKSHNYTLPAPVKSMASGRLVTQARGKQSDGCRGKQ